jgi:serine/threonine protein kinase
MKTLNQKITSSLIKNLLGLDLRKQELIAETNCSLVYRLKAQKKNYVLKKFKKKNKAFQEFNNHRRVYNLWLSNKNSLGFNIPQPYVLSKKRNFFVMEYIDNSRSLFDLMFTGRFEKLPFYFEKVGKCLAQYHQLITSSSLFKKKPITKDGVIDLILKSKYGKYFRDNYKKINRKAYKLISRDFKASNVLINKENQIYLIDFQEVEYYAPFYCDLARFYDTTKSLTFYKSPVFYLKNRKRIDMILDSFLQGYHSIEKLDKDVLCMIRKLHQIEHMFMKKKSGHNLKGILLKAFYTISK